MIVWRLLRTTLLITLLSLATMASAEARDDAGTSEAPGSTISVSNSPATDFAIRSRINGILNQVPTFSAIDARVRAGVVTLTGEVTEQSTISRLEDLIYRVDGVVAVENKVVLSTDIGARLENVRERFEQRLNTIVAGLPFVALGLAVGAVIVLLGGWISRRRKTIEHLTPNPFIADFLAQTIRLTSWVVALVVALDLMEAGALLGTLLGAAGIFGLSLSFASRDTIENFVATLILSLRQPFNPNDLIEVNTLRGRVIRMTSRGTSLLTLDGNHIRIPNQIIYKAVIINYTRNPERRFLVDLAVDPAADLWQARDLAVKTMAAMDFVLKRPEPVAWLEPAGANHDMILVRAGGWVSQEGTDFDLARGEAFRRLHRAMEDAGFAVPEIVHRVQLEGSDSAAADADKPQTKPQRRERAFDLSPDEAFEQMVDRERVDDGRNLLTPAPTRNPQGG
ncbi:mechanosensitive ion channel domain-containing protein [Paracoccus fistulariae]|uniref:Small-conductance mechanosensitive channel n=1 Tax=Paracoccus fistulariae TaxID=658446 RepID=A0ABY7SNL7_9RHOB|nr:mechanosensitive ion channel domain-containing protein [Paracoccus fistulariae]MDB6180345.1 mechanosensitive ion channel [Paracoccus fistulariae]WCR08426.1 mechanosensitive ion channel [Paracoccus fistulariae]